MAAVAPGGQAAGMSTRESNTPPVPEPLSEYRKLPNLITVLAIIVLVVVGVVAIALV
jgi:hypothetical protein